MKKKVNTGMIIMGMVEEEAEVEVEVEVVEIITGDTAYKKYIECQNLCFLIKEHGVS